MTRHNNNSIPYPCFGSADSGANDVNTVIRLLQSARWLTSFHSNGCVKTWVQYCPVAAILASWTSFSQFSVISWAGLSALSAHAIVHNLLPYTCNSILQFNMVLKTMEETEAVCQCANLYLFVTIIDRKSIIGSTCRCLHIYFVYPNVSSQSIVIMCSVTLQAHSVMIRNYRFSAQESEYQVPRYMWNHAVYSIAP